ncbi:MAG: hypothetical protein HYY48_01360 [Gammaproteobacteria bacterium]|nr:hypothetical protein [Gammaproteobacteria bacterium]
MRILSSFCGLLLVFLPAVSPAGGPVSEPHAMVYFQAHWSGQARDTRSTLGLRLDRNAVVENGVIEYQQLLQRPAMLDFRLGREGVQMFTIAGTDYAEWYRVHHADETAGSAESPPPQAAEAEGAAEAQQAPAEAKPAPETPEGEKTTIGGILDKAPVGVIMGVGLGIFLVSGLGG